MSEINIISHQAQHDLTLDGKTILSKHSSNWSPGLHTSQEGVCSTLFIETPVVFLAAAKQQESSAPSWVPRPGDWLGRSFVALAVCWQSLSSWKTTTIFSILAGLVARSSLVQVHSLVPDIFWQLFGFTNGRREAGAEETDSEDRRRALNTS